MIQQQRRRATPPRVLAAVDELRQLIAEKYPEALFEVVHGDDDSPRHIWLYVTVDVEDTDEVIDVVIDRQMEMLLDEDLPVYVMPLRPVVRLLEELNASAVAANHSA